MLLAMVDDIRVILVKLADRLHNMRTLSHLPEERRITIAQETRDIYAPIANRLGMSKVKNELEELSFRYLEPQAYEALRAKVDAKRRATEGLIEELKKTIAGQAARGAGAGHRDRRPHQAPLEHPPEAASGRRSSSSRCTTSSRCASSPRASRTATRRSASSTRPGRRCPGRIKDFIAMPRPNGYQSLHTSVISEHGMPFEVQIRTIEMHRMAEEGIAAHWKYKEGRVGDQRDERYFQWMRQLLEYQQEVRDPQEFIQNLKVDLYPEEVYTFTPKGLVKAFPRGATPIDFAYAIHTDVGHQCVGARVNGKMVPLRTRLKNGDIVEIVTQAGHKPSRDWLNFVVTSHARNKIKHLIRVEEKARAIELGRKVFEKEARRYDLNPKTLVEGDAFAKRARRLRRAEGRRVCSRAIGYGKVSAEAGARQARAGRQAAREAARRRRSTAAVKRVLGTGEEKIKVRGFDDLMVFRARCCNPIRGEKIVGYITRGKGVSVHSATCPNVVNLLYDPERRIDVEWDKGDARRALHREADDGGGGSEGAAGRRQREDRRHQHQHQEHGSAHRRRTSTRAST